MVPEDCPPQLNTQSSPFATFACAVSGASKGEKAESAQLGSRCQDCVMLVNLCVIACFMSEKKA